MTAEASKTIRAALKGAGYGTKQVSVRNDSYSMGSTVHVRIKDPAVPLAKVEAIANRSERVDRDEATGEILSGGNMFVEVSYEHGVLLGYAERATAQLADGKTTFGVFSVRADEHEKDTLHVWKRAAGGATYAQRLYREHAGEGLARLLATSGLLGTLDETPPAAPVEPEPEPVADVELLARMNAAAANVDPEPMRAACTVCTAEVEVDGSCAPCAAVARSQRERASRDPDSLAERLVEQSNRSGFSVAKIGRVEVSVSTAVGGDDREVTVNWPAVGAKCPSDALTFAIDLVQASRVALQVERLLARATRA
jgi:hypothetical protein